MTSKISSSPREDGFIAFATEVTSPSKKYKPTTAQLDLGVFGFSTKYSMVPSGENLATP